VTRGERVVAVIFLVVWHCGILLFPDVLPYAGKQTMRAAAAWRLGRQRHWSV